MAQAKKSELDIKYDKLIEDMKKESLAREEASKQKAVFGDPIPQHCKKCGSSLVKLNEKDHPRFNTITGEEESSMSYELQCPERLSKWNIFWTKDIGHSKFTVWRHNYTRSQFASVSEIC